MKTQKSISECKSPSDLVNRLYKLSSSIESFGNIIFWLIIISGVIISFDEMMVTEVTEQISYSGYVYTDEEKHFSFIALLQALAITGLCAFFERAFYRVLSIAVESLASITESCDTTSQLFEYTAYKIDSINLNVQQTSATTTNTSDNSKHTTQHLVRSPSQHLVRCPSCKTMTSATEESCSNCGFPLR